MNLRLVISQLWELTLLAAVSCTNSDGSYDIEKALSDEISIETDSLVSYSSIVPLGTDSSHVLRENSSIVFADEKKFIIWSGDHVYLFGSDGIFIRELGRYGRGHEEHGKITSCLYAPEQQTVYVCSFGNELSVYDVNGNYKKKMKLDGGLDGIIRALTFNRKMGIFGVKVNYTSDGVEVKLARFDEDGKTVSDVPLYSDNSHINVSIESFPLIYDFYDTVCVKLPYDDRLFRVAENMSVQTRQLNLGRLSPTRRHIEDGSEKGKLLKTKCQILSIAETSGHLYLICYYSMKYYSLVIDKQSKEAVFCQVTENPKERGALESPDGIPFWPQYVNGNVAYSLVWPKDIEPDALKDIASKHETGTTVKDDDCPLLYKYRER